MPQKDNVITRTSVDLYFILPGGFTKTGGGGVSANTLVKILHRGRAWSIPSRPPASTSRLVTTHAPATAPPTTSSSPRRHLQDRLPRRQARRGSGRRRRQEGRRRRRAGGTEGDADKDAAKDEKKPRTSPSGSRKAPPTGQRLPDRRRRLPLRPLRLPTSEPRQHADSPRRSTATPACCFNLLDQATGSKHLIGSRSPRLDPPPVHRRPGDGGRFEQQVGNKIAELEEKQQEAIDQPQRTAVAEVRRHRTVRLPRTGGRNPQAARRRSNTARSASNEKDLKREKDALSATSPCSTSSSSRSSSPSRHHRLHAPPLHHRSPLTVTPSP